MQSIKPKQHKKRTIFWIAGVVVVCLLIGAWFLPINPIPSVVYYATTTTQSFPEVDTSQLSEKQKSLLTILKSQYEKPQSGEFYSGGETQPWCANFVSWAMRENGMPYTNPHSGGWRIPGTRTLKDYYVTQNTFVPISNEYNPKFGDTILYQPPSRYGEHVNIVLKVQNGQVTTIGGNEGGQIRISTHDLSDTTGVIGYGKLSG